MVEGCTASVPPGRRNIEARSKWLCVFSGGIASNTRTMVLLQPVGVSVLVTPWNFPPAMATRKIGPALAVGCSVILKPASETPLNALLLASLLEEAGVRAGVVNVGR